MIILPPSEEAANDIAAMARNSSYIEVVSIANRVQVSCDVCMKNVVDAYEELLDRHQKLVAEGDPIIQALINEHREMRKTLLHNTTQPREAERA